MVSVHLAWDRSHIIAADLEQSHALLSCPPNVTEHALHADHDVLRSDTAQKSRSTRRLVQGIMQIA